MSRNYTILSLFFFLVLILSQSCSNVDADIIIQNGTVYDGTGDTPYTGDIAIKGDQIVKIGSNLRNNKAEKVDATGLAVAPGFIDLHAHLEPLPIIPDAESAIRMGVTTALGGPDGSSPINLSQYLDSLSRIGIGINTGYLIGHNSIRLEVLGMENREPSEEELTRMKEIAKQGMFDGAFGISTGLKYLPGAFSEVFEVADISAEVGKLGGIYTSHLREEGLGLIEGVKEAMFIGSYAKIPIVLTHHKAIGQPMWGASEKTLAMVDSARAMGTDVMIDQYPYTASYTSLSVLIPPWSMEGGRYDKFAERAADEYLRLKIKDDIVYNIMNDRGGGDLKRIQIAKFNYKPELEGKTLYDWAIMEGMEPTAENGAELIIEAQLNRGGSAIYHAMSEEDVERIMKHPYTMIASDGRITKYEEGFPHPRVYGTFPRVLGFYAREKALFPLEEAIRKMTALPASRMGLKDRGIINEGMKADLVIFDPESVIDNATFEKPHQFPSGIPHVLINGKFALRDSILSTERFGEVLRGPAFNSLQE